MSQFFSSKFLKYRQSDGADRSTIARDVHCPACGYNLRGLQHGGRCPECGLTIDLHKRQAMVLNPPGVEQRARMAIGLTLAAITLAVAALARGVLYSTAVFFIPFITIPAYLCVLMLNCIVWIIAAYMITPEMFDVEGPVIRDMRLWARRLQWLWPIGILLWGLSLVTGGGFAWVLFIAGLMARGGAGVGALMILYLLSRAAWDVELERESDRLTTALWFLPIFGGISALIPMTVACTTYIIASLFVITWAVDMLLVAWCLRSLAVHVRWYGRMMRNEGRRGERIAVKRAEIDARLHANIRPLGPNDRV